MWSDYDTCSIERIGVDSATNKAVASPLAGVESPWIGRLEDKKATLLITVKSPIEVDLEKEFSATVDSGYDGFVSLPLQDALSLGSILFGAKFVNYADGAVGLRLTCWGVVTVGSESRFGVISLEPTAQEVLLGLEFLRSFRKTLIIRPGAQEVLLVDEMEEGAAVGRASNVEESEAPTGPSRSQRDGR